MTHAPASSDLLCFLAVLAGVLVVSFLWSVAIDLDRIAGSLEKLARKVPKP